MHREITLKPCVNNTFHKKLPFWFKIQTALVLSYNSSLFDIYKIYNGKKKCFSGDCKQTFQKSKIRKLNIFQLKFAPKSHKVTLYCVYSQVKDFHNFCCCFSQKQTFLFCDWHCLFATL